MSDRLQTYLQEFQLNEEEIKCNKDNNYVQVIDHNALFIFIHNHQDKFFFEGDFDEEPGDMIKNGIEWYGDNHSLVQLPGMKLVQ